MSIEIKFTIRYTGGKADESLLDLYDAAASMSGLAKALGITSHALVNDGAVRHRVDSIPNVNFYLHPPKKGSFIELVTIVFENPAIQAIGSSVLAAAFWDFINFTWRQATGRDAELTEYKTRKLIVENDFLTQEIEHALERPLQLIHRPIQNDKNIVIEIRRPRIGTVLKFDRETYDYVMSQNDPEELENVLGNVTKYNNLSGIGRFYDDFQRRTISFHCHKDLTDEEKRILSWSLHAANQVVGEGKILLKIDVVKSNSGHIKRYIIKNVERNDNNQQRVG
jgi:hypothetical protein